MNDMKYTHYVVIKFRYDGKWKEVKSYSKENPNWSMNVRKYITRAKHKNPFLIYKLCRRDIPRED